MFIPIKDDVPTIRKPVVTIALIAINSVVFLFSIFLGDKGFLEFTYKFAYIPVELVHAVEVTPELAFSTYLTPFTSMFMHGGWLHLIGNMLFLWIYGNNVEDYFGGLKFVFFYLLSGLAAIALYTLFGASSEIPLVGASGAIAGTMGAYIVLHPKARITVLIIFFFIQFIKIPARVVLGIWFFMQLFMSLRDSTTGGGIAWMAHVGGFLFGFVLLKFLTKLYGRRGPRRSSGQRIYRMDWN
ncbi:MAG: rhomboid family intramembrane serine protease [candidate division Zixibacteria bacterium]|nr:rhomboid family intramembrane serine protease [candidate division Zixibacteria bacterium]